MALNTTFVAGTTVITAAHMNGIQSAWATHAATATNWTIGSGTLTFRYLQLGKTIIFRAQLAAGGTTSYTASAAQVSLPVAAHGTAEQAFNLKIFNGTSNFVSFAYIAASGTVLNLFAPSSTTLTTHAAMSTATVNTGTTGNWSVGGTYEAA